MPDTGVVSEIRKDFIRSLLTNGKRLDGRGPEDVRELKVETGVIGTADGSARVSLGDTKVMVGVKVEPGKPYPDSPDKGVLTTNAELVPLASPTFDLMAPNPKGVELARVVDRGIRESGCIDLSGLVVEPGEKVWVAFIDIHVLDYDGNLIDASGLAAYSALKGTVVRASKHGLGDDFQLPLKTMPVPLTSVRVGEHLVVDPGLDEDIVADARLTVTTDSEGHVRAMQKGLSGSLGLDDIRKAVRMSQDIGARIRGQL